jgi:hypothetical protein
MAPRFRWGRVSLTTEMTSLPFSWFVGHVDKTHQDGDRLASPGAALDNAQARPHGEDLL